MRVGLPYIIIFSTMSIDGRIASASGFSRLSCPYDKRRQMMLRCDSDAVIVGGNTVRHDNPLLTIRDIKCNKNPIRVIISHSLKFDNSLNIFTQPPKTIIYTDKREAEIPYNAEVVTLENTSICLIMEDLYRRGIRKVLIEGGGKTIYRAIEENCFNELRVTISPKLFGNGTSLLEGKGFQNDEIKELVLYDSKVCECKNEIHLIYKKHES
ncbi:dihydrofolate reductase family protein [Sulfuracidifex tepidarius]|uniref:2,5-diamino-6-ribosylamino-4(3H)-pyrimidinone 5'-phosphate reductase n=1 Tax=Sulfuracidifex tepidarius TaxID=1294262 RepID=A0A510E416_9CREN|nr:dihydrofolate reductase family protein [Sulfuracidifex tepidarius]BBG24495.1 2,5-diamino-6-ribosylamino-4(3H)-pyrimidinone 5'-phosphate reductase [Sulfuracidifex tepidarius]BBG27253.1 2,5-diamino-6-ribosylamino-4(3H)-pyrimidinone 5'-phosphate reductase [Sulfuracidifex tepidarius]